MIRRHRGVRAKAARFTLRVRYTGFDLLIDRLISKLVTGDPHLYDSGCTVGGGLPTQRDLFFDFATRGGAERARKQLRGLRALSRRILTLQQRRP